MNFETAKELTLGLFTDPRGSMQRALLPENEDTTRVLALVGFGVGVLGGLTGGLGGMITSLLGLVLYVGALYLGGKLAGGSGEPMGIALLCGFLYLPVGIVQTVTSAVGLGIIGGIFGAVAAYFIIVVGHGLEGLKTVLFVWVLAMILQVVAAMFLFPPIALLFH